MSPLLSRRSRRCWYCPPHHPACSDAEPHVFGGESWASQPEQPLLNLCSIHCVPLPHTLVFKRFPSFEYFLVHYHICSSWHLEIEQSVSILEVRKLRPSEVQGFAWSLMPGKTQAKLVNFWLWFQALSVALSYILGLLSTFFSMKSYNIGSGVHWGIDIWWIPGWLTYFITPFSYKIYYKLLHSEIAY